MRQLVLLPLIANILHVCLAGSQFKVFIRTVYCKKVLRKVLDTRVVEMGIEQPDNIRMTQTHHSIYVQMQSLIQISVFIHPLCQPSVVLMRQNPDLPYLFRPEYKEFKNSLHRLLLLDGKKCLLLN